MRKEALLYEKLEDKFVHCFLCGHHCRISEGKFGFCGVRQNVAGILYTAVYGQVIARHADPIEKKPLYHFLPGSKSFSIATIGCNFHCGFCQNWEISQNSVRGAGDIGEDFSPQEIVNAAEQYGCKSIAYTYTEPTIFFEYALDTAKLAKEKGLYNIFVTNGYMTMQALEAIRPFLDAANVDLKFFKDSSYKKICFGALEPVLNSIRLMKKMGVWVEITTLVVTGENDSPEELRAIAEFISGVDKNIPWHVSRFHPDYKFTNYAATSEQSLKNAQDIGKAAGLNYVYAGNVIGFGNDTYCHSCNRLLVRREIFDVLENHIKAGKCGYCNVIIPGVYKGG